uniref:Uncharacterized protein n=1 Tax=Arundo donax TaxID=35708 RepID=A0A0A9H9P5_ARUDO
MTVPVARVNSFKPMLQREFLGFLILGQPLSDLGGSGSCPRPLGHRGLLLLDVEEGDGAALEQREIQQLPPALLDEHSAVCETAAGPEALVHLLHRHRGRLVLRALRRGRGRRRVGEPGPRELPRHRQGRRGARAGARRRDGDLGLHLQERARALLLPLEAERPLDPELARAQRRLQHRRLPGIAAARRRRRKATFHLHVILHRTG